MSFIAHVVANSFFLIFWDDRAVSFFEILICIYFAGVLRYKSFFQLCKPFEERNVKELNFRPLLL